MWIYVVGYFDSFQLNVFVQFVYQGFTLGVKSRDRSQWKSEAVESYEAGEPSSLPSPFTCTFLTFSNSDLSCLSTSVPLHSLSGIINSTQTVFPPETEMPFLQSSGCSPDATEWGYTAVNSMGSCLGTIFGRSFCTAFLYGMPLPDSLPALSLGSGRPCTAAKILIQDQEF